MNWKKIIIRISKIVVFFLIFGVCLKFSGRFVVPKWCSANDSREGTMIRGFQDEKNNSLDVVFLGNSYFYRGVIPMELYEKSGITSYVYASSGQRIPTSYYYLKNIFKTQKPKVVFVNVDPAFDKLRAADSNIVRTIANMPIGEAKIGACLDKNNFGGKRAWLTSIFPVIEYHSRINELDRNDIDLAFGYDHCASKGFDPEYEIEECMDVSYMDKEIEGEDDITEKIDFYYSKMIELCKKNNARLELLQVPCHDYWNNMRHNATVKYAKKKNIRFIDLNIMNDKIGIDFKNDSSDGGDHLNWYGAKKVTSYLNDMLKNDYDLKNHRHEKGYEQWEIDLVDYHSMENDVRVVK